MECNKQIGAGKEEYNTKRMSGELKLQRREEKGMEPSKDQKVMINAREEKGICNNTEKGEKEQKN